VLSMTPFGCVGADAGSRQNHNMSKARVCQLVVTLCSITGPGLLSYVFLMS
jgi:hypothetical protein